MTNILRMKFKPLLLLILTISISGSGLSQKFINFPTWNVDSLLLVLADQQAEERINSLNKLAVSLSLIDFDSSIQYADEAMRMSKDLGYIEGVADTYRIYGQIHNYYGNYPVALHNFFNALSTFEKIEMKNEIARIYSDIALTHYFAVNYEKAIEYGYISLDKYHEKTKDGKTLGTVQDTMAVFGIIGLIYFLTDSCDKSLDITLKYMEVGMKNNFDRTDLFLHLILAGERFNCVGELDSAKIYLEKAINYPDENQNIETLKYRAVTSLGHLYRIGGEFDMAITYYKKAFDFIYIL